MLILSYYVHWGFISSILNLLSGFSLLFIAYLICSIILLDKPIEVELEYDWNYNYTLPKKMPNTYNRTVIYGVTLIILGIAAIFFTYRYKKEYAFECETFLVDENKAIYHLDGYNTDCEEIEEDTDLVRMKGYEIEEHNYSFCSSCEQWAEDAEDEYGSERFIRK